MVPNSPVGPSLWALSRHGANKQCHIKRPSACNRPIVKLLVRVHHTYMHPSWCCRPFLRFAAGGCSHVHANGTSGPPSIVIQSFGHTQSLQSPDHVASNPSAHSLRLLAGQYPSAALQCVQTWLTILSLPLEWNYLPEPLAGLPLTIIKCLLSHHCVHCWLPIRHVDAAVK